MRRGAILLGLAIVTAGGTASADDAAHVRVGARGLLLFRQDDGYFEHARVFVESPRASTTGAHLIGDPIPPAGGFHFEAGVELVPRLSLMGSFRTATDGVKTGSDTRLSLTSTAWVLDARYAVLRTSTPESVPLLAQLEVVAGVGRFTFREELVDRALFDGTKAQDAAVLGARFGVDASGYIGPIGIVVGYSYDVGPAKISDRLGGTISASGHAITFGVVGRF